MRINLDADSTLGPLRKPRAHLKRGKVVQRFLEVRREDAGELRASNQFVIHYLNLNFD